MRKTKLTIIIMLMAMIASCSDNDSSGVSRLAAEMCDMHTSGRATADYGVTDDDRRLAFTRQLNVSWATTPDSTYRAMLYYENTDNAEDVTPLYAESVLCLTPRTPEEAKDWSGNNDPLEIATAWYGQNRKYLNIRMDIMSGTPDSETQRHALGLVCDTVFTSPGGKRFSYRICHSQNGIPEYYTISAYASIPTTSMAEGDTISLVYMSHSGIMRRDMAY
ncbi:MAG: hypothetical protein ACI3Y5_06635 [Prevotella sp.]